MCKGRGRRKHSACGRQRRSCLDTGGGGRSRPGDLTQTEEQICLWAHEKHRLGLLSPLCWGRGGCVVADGVWLVWERAGCTHTHTCLSVCCSSQLFAASSPVVCRSYSQLFAVQHSSYLQSLPTYLQPYPQECVITTPAVRSHHRYLQPPPQLSAATFPAVCSTTLGSLQSLSSCLQPPPQLCAISLPLWASGKACSRLVLTTTITIC